MIDSQYLVITLSEHEMKCNVTHQINARWNGTFNMIDHYLKIRPFLDAADWHNILPILVLIPSLAEDARLREIFTQL